MKTWSNGEIVEDTDLNGNFSIVAEPNYVDVTAGEALTDGNTVYFSDGAEFDELKQSHDGGTQALNATSDWYAAFFTSGSENTKLKKVLIYMQGVNYGGTTGQEQITLSLRAVSGGVPTGSDLTSVTVSLGGNNGNMQTLIFNFSDFTISASTQYALVLRTGTVNITAKKCATGGASSSNSGSTWSASGTSFAYRVRLGLNRTVGRIYKTNASKFDIRNKVNGFATATVSAAASTKMQVASGLCVLSGLTAGSDYYLSDTAGAISMTAGIVPRRIGRALSTTIFKTEIKERTFVPLTTLYNAAVSGTDSGTIIRDTVVMPESSTGTTKVMAGAVAILALIAKYNTTDGKIRKHGASTYITNDQTTLFPFEVELDEYQLFDTPCPGYTNSSAIIITGYYI